MLATATHDHKRGEDVRARLNALSELPLEWRRQVGRWTRLNRLKRREIAGQRIPGRNDEYLLYQTLIGAWPLEIDSPEHADLAEFTERIVAYMIKASREAKVRTSWTAPDQEYEAGLERFVRRILDPQEGKAFLADLLAFQPRIALIGAINGLAQTLLKLTAPGVPDNYQGCELWDLSLVDPDNRRPVNFERRRSFLERPADAVDLLASWRDGRIKQHVVARTLALRRRHPEVFEAGAYEPLEVAGALADRVVAFSRRTQEHIAIVVVPRLVAGLLEDRELPCPAAGVWGDTRLELPPALPAPKLVEHLSERALPASSGSLMVADVLADLPVALLVAA
jgi:(1->4)-alpha-D-glucan 1-alpha-D-glucosylmutase